MMSARTFRPGFLLDEVRVRLPGRDGAGALHRPAAPHTLERGDVREPVRLGEWTEPGVFGFLTHRSALADRGARVH